MKSQDWMNQDSERAHVVERLSQLCTTLGLSFNYTEKKFHISLPDVVPVDVVGPHKRRKRINAEALDAFGQWIAQQQPGTDALPDELPPTTTPLDEGEKPADDTPEEDKYL